VNAGAWIIVALIAACAVVGIVSRITDAVQAWARARFAVPARHVLPIHRDQIPKGIAAAINASDYPIRIQPRDVEAAMEEINAAILFAMADRERRERETSTGT
jgi:hypothetical protein